MPKKIAILGGGIGGLTAAYEIITRQPDAEVTIFQMGWRLGGKCASSRNHAAAERIEEHGIHALFGAYENAFHLVRRVYGQLGQPWLDAFAPQDTFTLYDHGSGEWERWDFESPVRAGQPGDLLGAGETEKPTLAKLIKRLLRSVRDALFHHFDRFNAIQPATVAAGGLSDLWDEMLSRLDEEVSPESSEAIIHNLQKTYEHFDHLTTNAANVLDSISFRRHSSDLSATLRKLRVCAELAFAGIAGALRMIAHGTPLSKLDDVDATEWLNDNAFGGHLSHMAATSAPLRMIYESSFAFEDGDPNRPNYAARAMIRQLMWLLFDYRGHIAYKMKRGTAETLFTPLYNALKAKNVRFEFFHRVDEIKLTDDEQHVESVRFTVQSEAINGSYDPFVLGDCWPDKPRYELLTNGAQLSGSNELPGGGYDLEAERTHAPNLGSRVIKWTGAGGVEQGCFDQVVLAIPVAASRKACRALEQSASAGDRWRRMYENVTTTPTQSFQLWFDLDAKELGWKSAESALVGTYELPFSNWADMSDVLDTEKWPGGVAKNAAYLCGPLIESENLKTFDPEAWRAAVQDSAESWLGAHARRLWPKLFAGDKANWDHLVVVDGYGGKARLGAQFFQANLNASARYTLSRKGTQTHRIAPHKSGFVNLFLAGDWTRNGLDIGCVEATVISGYLAARAVLGLTKDQLPIYGEVE